ncbi:hypothetical protein [Mucilaginibacter celer]|uniref:Uncharacterized protein n=1 Tax=Mucilaginibacter celer TaxID=2305508 RepID=A0A494VQD2_9SPHI|nr:hypothetical protein [Mucilaginibacter celer]AYL97054.1 hypothetical protein HYN43_017840 [Mucilaginibacter celer]
MGLDLSHVVPTTDETLEQFTIEELSSNPEFIKRYRHMFKERDGELVLYFKEKGYQRKGMKVEFFDAFEDSKPYFEKKWVEKAMLYLKPNHPFGFDFKKNFVDNFIEGESIFYISW